MKLFKRDALKVTEFLQLCAREDAGSEAAIHMAYAMLNKENT